MFFYGAIFDEYVRCHPRISGKTNKQNKTKQKDQEKKNTQWVSSDIPQVLHLPRAFACSAGAPGGLLRLCAFLIFSRAASL